MRSIKRHIARGAGLLLVGLMAAGLGLSPAEPAAHVAAEGASRSEGPVVRYCLNETDTAEGQKLAAYKWDAEAQDYVAAPEMDATIQNSVNGGFTGEVRPVDGLEGGSALSFTGKAHARADFHLPANATGMTISLWVKNITTYWGSLVEFWDGAHGGRLGKGTMQGNGGRRNEADPWDQNCAAHASDVHASVEGGGWDSFVVTHNNMNNDNGGAAVDNMQADTWYQVTYVVTATEMKAYRDGVLKQHFTSGQAPHILGDIMTAVTNQTAGKLGIRLAHDTTDDRADILDDLRIYNGAMSDEEVRELFYEYSPSAEWLEDVPEVYETEGLSYPDLLLGGATEVRDEGGMKKGTTDKGVEYSYTPIAGTATLARDEEGVEVTFSKDGFVCKQTVRFHRTLTLEAQSLGYRLGDRGENVPISVPENADEDIVVKLPVGTDLTRIGAGEIAAKPFAEDSDPEHYQTEFLYSAAAHIATVRITYLPYPGQETFYTIVFAEKSTATVTGIRITGGKAPLELRPEELVENTAEVPVDSLGSFELHITLTLAEGASSTAKETYTQADLKEGKLELPVTNENGDTVSYFLVPKEVSSDASLAALTAGSYSLSPAFSSEHTEYTVTARKGEGDEVLKALSATPASSAATVAKQYDRTGHRIVVTVTAEDGTVRQYVITLTELDTDATLSELAVGGTAVPGFAPGIYKYTVKYTGEMPAVTAKASSDKAQVAVGTADGEGNVKVTVTAESGEKQIYTVALVKRSSDASLKSLTLGGIAVTFTGNSAQFVALAGARLEELSVAAEVAEGASVTHRLSPEEGKLYLTVTAEDGTTAEYTVTVTAAAAAFGEGTDEDNSPKETGCAAAAGSAGWLALFAALAVGLLLGKKQKKD